MGRGEAVDMRAVVAGFAVGAGCGGGAPDDPGLGSDCAAGPTRVEVAAPTLAFDALRDGDEVFCGIPPQGGAPYTPLRFRAAGPAGFGEGVDVRVRAVDGAEVLGDTSLQLGLVCANAGESAGWWTGGEVHLRYEGRAVEALDGRDAALTFSVTPIAGGQGAEVTVRVHLACDVPGGSG